MFGMLPKAALLLVSVWYPLGASLFTITSKTVSGQCPVTSTFIPKLNRQDSYTQWMIYWILLMIFTTWQLLINFIFSPFVMKVTDVFPMYKLMRFIFLLWLVHPSYCGALYLWETQLEQEFFKIKDVTNTKADFILAKLSLRGGGKSNTGGTSK